jgi:hypothetical protein
LDFWLGPSSLQTVDWVLKFESLGGLGPASRFAGDGAGREARATSRLWWRWKMIPSLAKTPMRIREAWTEAEATEVLKIRGERDLTLKCSGGAQKWKSRASATKSGGMGDTPLDWEIQSI